MKNSKYFGILSLVLCSLFWSTGGVLVKLVDYNSIGIAGTRSFFAAIFLIFFCKRLPRLCVKDENGITDKAATFDFWMGGIMYGICMTLFVVANKLTTAANTIFLQYTNPIYIILFGPLLLKEKNRRSDYLSVVGVAIGMILFFSDSMGNGNLKGDIVACLSGFCFGFTNLFLHRLNKKNENYNGYSNDAFIIAHILTFIVSVPFIIQEGVPSPVSCFGLILLGVVQMGLASYFYGIGISKEKALTVSFVGMLEPLMNPVWVLLIVHEVPGIRCIFGGIIIISCVVLRTLWQGKKKIS